MPKKTKKTAAPKIEATPPPFAPPVPAITMPSPQPQTGRREVVRAKDFRKRFGLA